MTSSASLSVHVNGETHSYDIGESESANKAVESYAKYLSSHQFEDLKSCFASLHYTVFKDPEKKLNACRASHALALSVFKQESNIYRKFFIANSVTSAIAVAQLVSTMRQTHDGWTKLVVKYGAKIAENFDATKAKEAGLAILDLDKPVVLRKG